MDAEDVRTLFGYHYWARDRLLSQVAHLSPEAYAAPCALDYGSIRATLIHSLSAEAGYLARWKGEPRDNSITETNLPTAAALQERWAALQQQTAEFLAKLTDADVRRDVRYVSRTGQEYTHPLWALMAQCINHGTQHRSEVALALTQLGHSPGDLDLIVYLRELSRRDQ